MIARYNRVWTMPEVKECPIKIDFELVKKIIPISFNEDKSVKEYTEEEKFVKKTSKWKDYINSFDLGSPSEQILEHLTKGTPLVTAHTLPHGDYRPEKLLKGAEIVKEMREKGITLEMIQNVLSSKSDDSSSQVKTEVDPSEKGE